MRIFAARRMNERTSPGADLMPVILTSTAAVVMSFLAFMAIVFLVPEPCDCCDDES